MIFSKVWTEIEAWEKIVKWAKTRTPKGIVLLLVVALIWFVFKDVPKYSKSKQVAIQVYSEVFVNVKTIDEWIANWDDPSFITSIFNNPERYKRKKQLTFLFDKYDNFYKPFNKGSLDIQITNFYTNLKKYNSDYDIRDFKRLKEQGVDVLKRLNCYFGCKDVMKILGERAQKQYNIISQDTSVPTFSLACYLRYRFD